jgi:predicted Zn-dependent peptidase
MFSDVIGSGASSRCSSRSANRGLAYTVSSTLHPYADTGLFYIYAATARSQAAHCFRIKEIVAEAPRRLPSASSTGLNRRVPAC